jgi:hypothetical protein
MNIKTKIFGTLAAVALLGGGTAAAFSAQAAAPAAAPSVAALAAAGGVTSHDIELVQREASYSLAEGGRADVVRAPGEAVKALVLAPGEDPGDGGKAFGKTVLVARVDGSVDASLAIPHRMDEKLPAVDTMIVVMDPDDGHMITTVYLAASDTRGKARFVLAELGASPASVDIPAKGKILIKM